MRKLYNVLKSAVISMAIMFVLYFGGLFLETDLVFLFLFAIMFSMIYKEDKA